MLPMSHRSSVPLQHWYRREQTKLRVLHRRVARRTTGSKKRGTAGVALPRQHAHSANTRKDFLNTLVHEPIQEYDRSAVEDLRFTNMVQHRHLAKSMLDVGWGSCIGRLHNQAEAAGRVGVAVDPRHTSRTCSGCGFILVHITLKDRQIDCPHC
ncbi:MAG: zinc ribbon domain-containing protein [Actinomycetota bacterium]|nr:zinc ribbon domain-containing protein [Actinomycetota bacterium]